MDDDDDHDDDDDNDGDDDDDDNDDKGGATPKFLFGPKQRQRRTLPVNKAINKQILKII